MEGKSERTDPLPLLVKPERVAQELGISRSKVYALMARGELPSLRLGGNRRVERAALEAFIAGLQTESVSKVA